MKKRFPTLVAIGGVILVFSLLFVKRACSTEPGNQDQDKDGIVNDKDACPDVYAKTPDGCPTKVEKTGDDQDKDGFLGGFQKDTSILDRDDSDPCIPNPTCDYCDQDGDGLTYPQEIAKRTDPTNMDSDQDGVNDRIDSCPVEYGVADNNGCKLQLDVGIKRNRKTISWNPGITKYTKNIRLIVTEDFGGRKEVYNNFVAGTSVNIGNLQNGFHYSARMVINLENPKAVEVRNENLWW